MMSDQLATAKSSTVPTPEALQNGDVKRDAVCRWQKSRVDQLCHPMFLAAELSPIATLAHLKFNTR